MRTIYIHRGTDVTLSEEKQKINYFDFQSFDSVVSVMDVGDILCFPDVFLFYSLADRPLEESIENWILMAKEIITFFGQQKKVDLYVYSSRQVEINDGIVDENSSKEELCNESNIMIALSVSGIPSYRKLKTQLALLSKGISKEDKEKLLLSPNAKEALKKTFYLARYATKCEEKSNELEKEYKLLTDTYELELDRLNTLNESLSVRLKSSEQYYAELESKKVDLEKDLTVLQNSAREKETDFVNLEELNQRLQKQLTEALEKQESLKERILEANERHLELTEAIEKKNSYAEEVTQSLVEKQKLINSMKEQSEAFRIKAEELDACNNDLLDENCNINKELGCLKEANQKLVTQLAAAEKMQAENALVKNDWVKKSEILKNELNNFREANDSLIEKLASFEKMRLMNAALRSDLVECTNAQSFLAENLIDSKREVNSLRVELESTKKEVINSKNTLENAKASLDSERKRSENLSKQLATYRTSSERETDKLLRICEEYKNEMRVLEKSLVSTEKSLRSSKDKVSNTAVQLRREQTRSKELESMLDSKRTEFLTVKNLHAGEIDTLNNTIRLLEERSNKSILKSEFEKVQSLHNKHIETLKNDISKVESEKKEAVSKFIVTSRELAKSESKHDKLRVEFSRVRYELYCLDRAVSSKSTLFGAIKSKIEKVRKLKDKAYYKTLQQDTTLIATSEYFDIDWYLSTYSDVREAGINPAEHYLIFGAVEARMPSASFDTLWYLERYPDVKQSGINPLLHFIKYGCSEGRTVSPKLIEKRGQNG